LFSTGQAQEQKAAPRIDETGSRGGDEQQSNRLDLLPPVQVFWRSRWKCGKT
jgi:hypothetical protein